MSAHLVFQRFGPNSKNLLLGLYHNTAESREIVHYVLNNYSFNNFYVELNENNKNFILKNNFSNSEFYEILKRPNKNKHSNEGSRIKLIDISIEREISSFEILRRRINLANSNNKNKKKNELNNCSGNQLNINIFDVYINFKLSKYIFYKIWNYEKITLGSSISGDNKKYNNETFTVFFVDLLKNFEFYYSHILYRELYFLYRIRNLLSFNIFKKKEGLDSNININNSVEKYFGLVYDFFQQKIEYNINKRINDSNNQKNFSLPISHNIYDNNSIKTKDESEYNNDNALVIIGKFHFEKLIDNNLIK